MAGTLLVEDQWLLVVCDNEQIYRITHAYDMAAQRWDVVTLREVPLS